VPSSTLFRSNRAIADDFETWSNFLSVSAAAVANGGTLVRPYLVAAAVGPDGERIERPAPAPVGRATTESTAREVERLLEAVVSDGTGKAAAVPGYPVAGKTGTAQKAVAGGGYAPDRFVASFVGFAPARRPALVAAVVVDEPRPRYHGGEVAAPAFAAMVEPILLHLGIEPEREPLVRWPGEPGKDAGVLVAAAVAPGAALPEETW
jgi:cell division protein FtsI/penicillin-binding protein 2